MDSSPSDEPRLTESIVFRPADGPDLSAPLRWLVRVVYTHNPFYLLSAWLVFTGLRFSFDTSGRTFQTEALMLGLIGYTTLLALAAWVLIRVGKVWEDVRTQLLLVLLMLLGMSVTFDQALAAMPRAGMEYFLGGLAFAVGVSEGLLRGLQIRLPSLFRLPYYLILSLFFLYPVAVAPMVSDPDSLALQWALFGFSPLAGLLFLTLLPAIRRGPEYVRENGTPWRWPWFPWVVFGTLALGVCGRSYYLCVSLHFVNGSSTIFAPYFLVPFLLALDILLLESGLVLRSRTVVQVAMIAPVALLGLAVTGPAAAADDLGFLALFAKTLGGTPLFVTLLALLAFYAAAFLRRVPYATPWLVATIAALSVVQASSADPATMAAPRGLPILAAGALALCIGVYRRSPPWCLLAACGLVAGATLQLRGTAFIAYRGLFPIHLLLAATMVIAAVSPGRFARVLQRVCGVLLLLAGAAAVFGEPGWLEDPPAWLFGSYPLFAIVLAASYGYFVRNRSCLAAALGTAACWLAVQGGHAYVGLRQNVAGLDKIALGAAFFLVAMFISLIKAGVPQRWLARWPHRTAGKPADALPAQAGDRD